METLIQFLHQVHPLSPALEEHLRTVLRHRLIKRNDHVLKAGHISQQIFFVKQGLFRCYYDKGEKEICTWFMQDGDVLISVESFFSQQPSFEHIQALEDSEVWYISYAELQAIYQQYPEFNVVGRRLTEKYYQLAQQELRMLRMYDGVARYQWLLEHHPQLILRVRSKHLASWLSVTEQYLSMIKARVFPH